MYKKTIFQGTSRRLTNHLVFLPEDELSVVQLHSVSAAVLSPGQVEAGFLLFGSCAMLCKQRNGQVSAMCWDTSQPLMKRVRYGEMLLVANFITMSLFTCTFETRKLQHNAF